MECRFRKTTLDQIGKKISAGEMQELDIIIKGDVDGSTRVVGRFLSGVDEDGYAKVSISLPNA